MFKRIAFTLLIAGLLISCEKSDKITPFEPIRRASEGKKTIQTFFTYGQDHNLKGPDTVEKVIQFIKN